MQSFRRVAASTALAALAACTAPTSETHATATGSASVPATSLASTSARPKATAAPMQLPGGGTTLFPRDRVVAFYGAAGVPGLGVLGQGTPDAVAAKLLVRAHAYAAYGRPVVPAFELIATVVQQEPGLSGTYSVHVDDAAIDRYLAAARRIHGLLVLDIQPGYRSFADDVRHYERYLEQPDVGLALDSEWSMQRGEVPGKVVGHTTASSVNAVSAYLARIVREHRLPQKLLAIHQFTPAMIADSAAIVPRPGLAITIHIDGFGKRDLKRADYTAMHRRAPFFNGFKLFLTQDIDMYSAADVMRFAPPPDLITYE